ncbi:uncharacterized protein LOC117498597 [Trematomus bernacchii]|uniref:uncharacterized protein LOC117498597 n=1 Tax=Trematomus bernacchii TaxID=40690 RepID=UPI00146DD26B|nr:uncharacterized protein LOC117498597 [Trematomus bernacchii]
MSEGESPLGQALQRLAHMQETTTALQRQQSEALLGIASSQREDRALLRELLQRPAAREADPATNPARPPSIALQKLTADDDPEAYLDIFEGTAAACGWPEEEWAARLLPLLSGGAQLAAHSLPAASRHVYRYLRKAILDRLGSTPEGHRRRFRALPFEDADRPFSYAQQLLDAASRWLQPGVRSAEEVVGQVALEQLIAGLPSSTANWVQCHRPANLEAAVVLAEDHLSLPRRSVKEEPRPPAVSAGRPIPAPRRRFPGAAALPPPPPHGPNPAAPTLHPQALPYPPVFISPQGPAYASGRPAPRGAPQTPGLDCWRCGQPGHFRRECPLMEVGQLVRVAGPPVASPDLEGTYRIPTDASNSGVGAVLSQQVEGVDRPVLYISRKLAQREVNYSTVEKECLAIRWAVGALRYYLLGRPFTLWSDHAPLQWLHRMKDANARITRWYLALQPFNFKVIHRPGNQMVVADFLSRSAEGGGGESACGRRGPGLSRGGGGMWQRGVVRAPAAGVKGVARPEARQLIGIR